MRSGDDDGYDAVFLSPHKFLGGPGSPGVLAMASRLYRLRRTAPSTSGGGTVLYACIEAREARMLALALRRVRAAANPNLRLLLGADPASAPRLPVLSFVVYSPYGEAELEGGGTEQTPATRLQLHCRFVTKLLNDLFGVQARAGCACAGPYGHRLLGISPARAKAIRSAVEQSYMACAHRLADSLAATCSGLGSTRARRIPKGVDPQLVYFVV
ncbi:putative cysteine desulfurase [Panicum miliaceum]|uniref:Cysteine desulfurase n=1 Tax=Panicum miliaceum TaxID=4540 RepID=A0A3L6QXG1_PANMI|nr:putative cysteine desulfurase [Panicum miliaceum]